MVVVLAESLLAFSLHYYRTKEQNTFPEEGTSLSLKEGQPVGRGLQPVTGDEEILVIELGCLAAAVILATHHFGLDFP